MLKVTLRGGPKSKFSVYVRNGKRMHDADKQYLTDRYYDFFTTALMLLRNEEEAKDAVQEALAKTMALPWTGDPYKYCCRVLRNYCCDRLKERYIVAEFPDLTDESDADPVFERRLELLPQLKKQLPKETVLLLDLHYGMGMTLKETADMTGMTEGRVKKKIIKALRKLKAGILYEESKLIET